MRAFRARVKRAVVIVTRVIEMTRGAVRLFEAQRRELEVTEPGNIAQRTLNTLILLTTLIFASMNTSRHGHC
jgi:hypothetical protein